MYVKYVKRFLDIVCALATFIFLWPLFLVIALLVRVKLGSPIIFKQVRIGKDGKPFVIYKFRTMRNMHDKNGNDLPDRLRVTKFGNALRKTSLDEIPEAFNILRGDMSIIGPRPLLVKDYVFFSDKVKQRCDIRPGLSGLAQVSGRNSLSWEQRFEYDLEYVDNVSFLLDVRLLFGTILKAFFKRDNINKEGFATDEDYGDYLLRTNQISQTDYNVNISNKDRIIDLFNKESSNGQL